MPDAATHVVLDVQSRRLLPRFIGTAASMSKNVRYTIPSIVRFGRDINGPMMMNLSERKR